MQFYKIFSSLTIIFSLMILGCPSLKSEEKASNTVLFNIKEISSKNERNQKLKNVKLTDLGFSITMDYSPSWNAGDGETHEILSLSCPVATKIINYYF
jgi:hypothetical protein